MATLNVGPGKSFARVADAVKAASDGDVVLIQAGTYVDDFPVVNHQISMVGVGGMPRLLASHAIPNGKGIVIANANLTVDNIEFAGASVDDLNGAGIRLQGGKLVVTHSRFINNQMHILTNNYADGEVRISDTEFGPTIESAKLSHGVYIGRIDKFVAANNFHHDTATGHHVKSRAKFCDISNSRMVDGDGASSYSVDLPNGGNCVLSGNVFVQGERGENGNFIHVGGEGEPYPATAVFMQRNVFINDKASGNGTALFNQTAFPVQFVDNKLYRVKVIGNGPFDDKGTMLLKDRPVIDRASGKTELSAGSTEVAFSPEAAASLAGGGFAYSSVGMAFAVLGVAGWRMSRNRRDKP